MDVKVLSRRALQMQLSMFSGRGVQITLSLLS